MMGILGSATKVQLVLAGICLFGALWWVLEAARLFLRYRSATAEVVDRTYTDQQQQRNRADHPWDRIINLSPHSLRHAVADIIRVRYTVAGREYQQVITTGRLRGVAASRNRTVWYDPDDPGRILQNGPVSSLRCSLAALIFAGMILDLI